MAFDYLFVWFDLCGRADLFVFLCTRTYRNEIENENLEIQSRSGAKLRKESDQARKRNNRRKITEKA